MQMNFLLREFLTKIKKQLLLISLLTFVFSNVYGQNSREDASERYLNIGKYLIKSGNYDSAATVLKSAFIKGAVLQDELLYYYSFVLYKNGDLDQSLKFIDKFISISSPKAELFDESLDLKQSIDDSIDANSISCTHCGGIGSHSHTCDKCAGSGEQICDTCNGKGKVLIGGANGMRFGVCITCMGDGKRNCVKCGGEKKLSEACSVCKGKGKVRKPFQAIK